MPPRSSPGVIGSASPSAGLRDGEISLLEVYAVLLSQRRLVIGIPLVLFVLVIVVSLLLPRKYTVSTSFLPRQGSTANSLAATLAARFGLPLPQADPSESPQFFGSLVESPEILRGLVSGTYATTEGAAPQPLADLLDASGFTEAERVEDGMRLLKRYLSVTVVPETGVVKAEVTTKWALVSVEIMNRLLSALNDFILERRQSMANADRRFTEERVSEAASDLRRAEDELQSFLQRNRAFQTSPELLFEHDRLQRAVNMRQDVYTSLVQALENARLDEARNTPLLTVLETPRARATADRRHLLLKGALALLLGFVLGAGLALGRHGMQRAAVANPEVAEQVRSYWADSGRRLTEWVQRRKGSGDAA